MAFVAALKILAKLIICPLVRRYIANGVQVKKSLFLAFLLFSFNLNAGGYYQSVNQGYDAETGLFFYPIKHKPDSGGMFSSKSNTRIKNILIFDPKTEKQSYLFELNKVWDIKHFSFETSVSKSNGIQFFGSSYNILNNPIAIERKLKDQLLIITGEKDSEELTMWYATKQGQNFKVVHRFHKSVKWHIDLKNSKVRFITHKKEVSFKSIEW